MTEIKKMEQELEELKREKKELELRIKHLQATPTYQNKRWKIDVSELPYRPKRYILAMLYQTAGNLQRERYQTVFASEDRATVINEIPSIIEELQGLYEMAIWEVEKNEK